MRSQQLAVCTSRYRAVLPSLLGAHLVSPKQPASGGLLGAGKAMLDMDGLALPTAHRRLLISPFPRERACRFTLQERSKESKGALQPMAFVSKICRLCQGRCSWRDRPLYDGTKFVLISIGGMLVRVSSLNSVK